MNSLEVRRCLVEMHAVLGEDVGFRSKEDLLELDRDHFPSDLGLFLTNNIRSVHWTPDFYRDSEGQRRNATAEQLHGAMLPQVSLEDSCSSGTAQH
jgi:hypothetical protein